MQISERNIPRVNSDLPLHPVLARVYAARGVTEADQLELVLKRLEPWYHLKDIAAAVELLIPIVTDHKRLLVVGDFDVDGATSTALVIRALRMLGATQLDYLVPNRFDFGYGLSPELVDVALERKPDLIMTVDNGIASIEGVERAGSYGIPVLVTDHHLAAAEMPKAAAIVNPNQPGCEFPSKAACGCTVAFYVMLALRAKLVEQALLPNPAPNLAQLLDLVALATVADVVPLDANNRILVEQGLLRIRAGQTIVGIKALLEVSGRRANQLVAADFGFALGPRLNAAGRLDDISVGIECLLTDSFQQAMQHAQVMDEMNRDRRSIEQGMQQEAGQYLAKFDASQNLPTGLVLHQEDWHQGVVGILASRIKDKTNRPVIAMATDDQGWLKGSARSIAGLHIRDALDEVHKQAPHLIKKFGGHAMAAGLTLAADGLDEFRQRFDQVCRKYLSEDQLQQIIETDGQLQPADFNFELAQQLRMAGPWGQSFPEPIFHGLFQIVSQRIVGERHLKLMLRLEETNQMYDAIWFGVDLEEWPDTQTEWLQVAYQLDINEYQGQFNLQLMVKGAIKQ